MTAAYDALNRVISVSDPGAAGRPSFSVTTSYDAVGNVRRRNATHQTIAGDGSLSGTSGEDYWYRYDALNRFVTTQGRLVGGVIVRGDTGTDITYNAASERASATRSNAQLSRSLWVGRWNGVVQKFSLDGPDDDGLSWSRQSWRFVGDQIETYGYDADGNLATMSLASAGLDLASDTSLVVTAPGASLLSVRDTRDAMGRVTLHEELTAGYSRSAVYDAASRVTSDFTSQVQGADTFTGATLYDYGTGAAYANGAVVMQMTDNKKNGSDTGQKDTATSNSYVWWDGAVQAQTLHNRDTAFNPNATFNQLFGITNSLYTSTYSYDANGHLKQVQIVDGRPRSVSFANNAEGQVLSRREADNNASTGDPSEFRFYLNGETIGLIGNDGTDNISYGAALALRGQSPATAGAFAPSIDPNSGAVVSAAQGYADFDQNFDRINATSQGEQAVPERYTVREGETLQSIALTVWPPARSRP